MGILIEIKDSGFINRVTNEAVTSQDIDAALEDGKKVFVSFGGDYVEVVKVEYSVVEA